MSPGGARGRARPGCLACALLALAASRAAAAQDDAGVPTLGCYSYGYNYTPALSGIHNPVSAKTTEVCRANCDATKGCAKFTYFPFSSECWLAGRHAVLAVAQSLGAISGPARCARRPSACADIPLPGFPGESGSASRAAWESGDQPTNLQCWPRDERGFPTVCEAAQARVVEDTRHGWPGRCQGMTVVPREKLDGETCQVSCMKSPLCSVWLVENTSSQDGLPVCRHGLRGADCYSPEGPRPIIAQRIVHGSTRVLMNSAGMQVNNLVKSFGPTYFSTWDVAAKHCRLACASSLLCQFWQYSEITGCWVEDPTEKMVAYPLVDDDVGMTTNVEARQIKAGEYVQHVCRAGDGEPGAGAPEIFPPETLFGGLALATTATTTTVTTSTPDPTTSRPRREMLRVTATPTAEPPAAHTLSWVSRVLVFVLAALCAALVVAGAVYALKGRGFFRGHRRKYHQRDSAGSPLHSTGPGSPGPGGSFGQYSPNGSFAAPSPPVGSMQAMPGTYRQQAMPGTYRQMPCPSMPAFQGSH